MFNIFTNKTNKKVSTDKPLNINLTWSDLKPLNQVKNNYHNLTCSNKHIDHDRFDKIELSKVLETRKVYLDVIYN